MGAINEIFISNKITFPFIGELIQFLTNNCKNKQKNINYLTDIGLIKEYLQITELDKSNNYINISRKTKRIKNLPLLKEQKYHLIQLTKKLLNINKADLNSPKQFNGKINYIRNGQLDMVFFQNNLKKFMKTEKFNKLLNYGLPNNLRNFIWEVVISEKYANNKIFNYNEEKKEYDLILNQIKQDNHIIKDMNRTFTEKEGCNKVKLNKLSNILHCISKYNNDDYCQGMNFIVKFLLKLNSFNEVKTFYILKNIINDIKGYFDDDFPLLYYNLNKFDLYFKELYPKLYFHFKKCQVYPEFWVGKWFQMLFVLSFPFEELCIIWDNLLIKGFDYVIYIALALIGSMEKYLLLLEDSSDILEEIKNMCYPKEDKNYQKVNLEEALDYVIPLNKILAKADKIQMKLKEKFIIEKFKPSKDTKSRNSTEVDSLTTKESENSLTSSNNLSTFSSIKSGKVKSFNSSNSINSLNPTKMVYKYNTNLYKYNEGQKWQYNQNVNKSFILNNPFLIMNIINL